MRVCHSPLRRSDLSLRQASAPVGEVKKLRDFGRKARLFGAFSDDPVIGFIARLETALGRRPVFFEPSSVELSFDEAWLLNLFDAINCNDQDRYCFAMRSRMSRTEAANLHFFAIKAARGLDLL